jgi:hypothetical protein
VVAAMWMLAAAHGQTCQGAADVDPQQRTAIETAAKHYFELAARGDTAGLRQVSIPAVADNFAGIEAAVKENQTAFSQAEMTVRSLYALGAEGSEPLARAEFLCGVFGASGQTSSSVIFVLHNLPPGKYAVAILDAKRGQNASTLTLVLQQVGADWKLAGFYARPAQINGHDGAWFAQRAREFKAKGQSRNAWLYFQQAIASTAPADFVSTLATDKLYDEAQAVQPTDLPVNGSTIALSAGATNYTLTSIFPLAVGNDFDLVVRYQAVDVSDTYHTFQTNVAVMKALLAKFPEFRDAFDGVVARAVEPSGRDYGSMLPMKDIK